MEFLDKIIIALIGMIFGTIGGGLFSFYQRKKNAQIDDKIEAKRKLKQYSKSLWIDLNEINFRLKHIKAKLESGNLNEIKSLSYYPDPKKDIDWYTKDGYYITSTVYLFSSLSSWISIYQRDTSFLDFGNDNISSVFYRKIKSLKLAISGNGSIMWYYYFNSIGEKIIDNDHNSPLTFASFINLLDSDTKFKLFFSQTFYFINSFTKNNSIKLITEIILKIEDCKKFIEENTDIPDMKT